MLTYTPYSSLNHHNPHYNQHTPLTLPLNLTYPSHSILIICLPQPSLTERQISPMPISTPYSSLHHHSPFLTYYSYDAFFFHFFSLTERQTSLMPISTPSLVLKLSVQWADPRSHGGLVEWTRLMLWMWHLMEGYLRQMEATQWPRKFNNNCN